MSRAFTTNPPRTVPRGRGRGQNSQRGTNSHLSGSTQPRQNRQEMQDGIESSGGGNPKDASDRTQRRDAYTMFAPKADKRQDITERAQREEENYRKYKEQRKPGAFNYMGTAGGGAISEEKSRQRAVNQDKQATFNVRQKSQQYRDETRKKETVKLDAMKNQQRKKTEQNVRRDSARQRDLKNDHTAKNEAFLQRIERENQQKKSSQILRSSAAAAYVDDGDSPGPSQRQHTTEAGLSRLFTEKIEPDSSEASGGRVSPDYAGDTVLSPLESLCQEFPGYDPDTLENLLLQCNGHIDRVRELIGS